MNETNDEQIPPQDPSEADTDGGNPPPPPGDAPPPPPPPPGADTPPPPPPPFGAPPRPLLRRDDDKVFAGVAGGLADFVGVDPTVVRVAFVILTVFGGIGVPLYLVGWAGLRTPSMPESHAERWFRGAPNPVVLIALAVGFIVLINVVHAGPGDGVGWGLALIFAGWLLFRADNRAVAGGPTTAPPAPPDSTWSPGAGWYGPGGTANAPPAPPPAPVWHPAPPRPRSILGRVTFGLALAAAGVAALLDQLGAVDLQPVHYPALAMTVTGLGLVVGAWRGRAYGLVWLGLLLIPVTIAASFAPLPLRGGAGDVTYRPTSITTVDDSYRLGVGELLLDLSAVDFQGATTTVEVSVGLGEATIIVPDDVTVDVGGEMRAGKADLFGTRTVGDPFLADLDDTDEGTGAGRLELTIDHGIGDLTIRRANQEF